MGESENVFVTDTGQRLVRTHNAQGCAQSPIPNCAIHNPSERAKKLGKLHWRVDRGFFERICEHGVGHPDPDDARFQEGNGREDIWTHGCDGCCWGAYSG